MSGSVNKVILVGNLGREPEVRTMQNGGKVCNLSVATSERWKDRNSGEMQERTEWHRVVIFDERSSLGLVKMRLKRAHLALAGLLESIEAREGQREAPPQLISEISDDDIDALFALDDDS